MGAVPPPMLGSLGGAGASSSLGAVPMEELQAELRRRHAYSSARLGCACSSPACLVAARCYHPQLGRGVASA